LTDGRCRRECACISGNGWFPTARDDREGLRVTAPGEITFPVIQRNVERIVLVSGEEIRAAVKFLLLRMKILVEPSGAASAAALLFHKLPASVGRAGVVLSGGNVDFDVLREL
jgi:threonine dehydratase